MDTRVNYAAVGAFVLLLGGAMAGLAVWFGASVTNEETAPYAVYFHESVAGLNRSSPVNYQGVVVGRVRSIELAPADPHQVRVVVDLLPATPVKTDTVARLVPQGVTGVVLVELAGGSRDAPPPRPGPGDPYPVIESQPSVFARLDTAVSEGVQTLDQLALRLNEVLSADNIAAASTILANVRTVTETLAGNSERIERTLAGTDRLARELPALVERVERTLDRFDAMTAEVRAGADGATELIAAGRDSLGEVNRTTLPQLNRTLDELYDLSRNLGRLTEELSDNPRTLIFGRPSPAPGPGEQEPR
jgi:phospholipid/cholesterol/gamma-HCH transport system substrate-binding protein